MDVFIPMIENEVVKEILAKDINFHDCLKKAVLINTLNNKLPIKDFKPIKNKI
jgi:hypothetical protein